MSEVSRDSKDDLAFKAAEAAAFLEEDKRQRVGKCLEELQLLLSRFDCSLIPEVSIVGSQVSTTLRVVAK